MGSLWRSPRNLWALLRFISKRRPHHVPRSVFCTRCQLVSNDRVSNIIKLHGTRKVLPSCPPRGGQRAPREAGDEARGILPDGDADERVDLAQTARRQERRARAPTAAIRSALQHSESLSSMECAADPSEATEGVRCMRHGRAVPLRQMSRRGFPRETEHRSTAHACRVRGYIRSEQTLTARR